MTRPGLADGLLAAAVRTLPGHRAEWGRAMRADLAAVESRADRWWFVLGCLRVVLQPRTAPMLRLGCCLAVAATAAGIATGIASSANPGQKLREGGWILALLLAGYLFGFIAVTSRRRAPGARVLLTGAGAGLATIAAAALLVLASPPVPREVGPAVLLVALGAVGAAALVQPRHGDRAATLAGLLTATIASLGIVILVDVIATVGSPELIPMLAPQALPAATQIAESRIELIDPYIGLLLLGALAAVLLGVSATTTRRIDGSAPSPRRS